MRLHVFLIVSAAILASPAFSEAQVEAEVQASGLRAELMLDRNVYFPTQSIPVRFTLFNPADETVELGYSRADNHADDISLPREFVLGGSDYPVLFITYEKEAPVAIVPPADVADVNPEVLRLAPKTALGTELDLVPLYRHLRYSGNYRLDWRPFGTATPSASIAFRVEVRKDAVMVTDYGKITFRLCYEQAPRNVENFLDLVKTRFYERKIVHRLIPGFIMQSGSPDGTNRGIHPDGRLIPAEFHDVPFELGTLAMARKPKDPDSASCQFFVSLGRNSSLDGQFTVIGQAYGEESLRTLRELSNLPTDFGDRPVKPLTIRNVTLIDAQQLTVTESIK